MRGDGEEMERRSIRDGEEMRGDGEKICRRWRGDGEEMRGDGEELERRWRGDGEEMKRIWRRGGEEIERRGGESRYCKAPSDTFRFSKKNLVTTGFAWIWWALVISKGLGLRL